MSWKDITKDKTARNRFKDLEKRGKEMNSLVEVIL